MQRGRNDVAQGIVVVMFEKNRRKFAMPKARGKLGNTASSC